MFDVSILENGNLEIRADDEARAELALDLEDRGFWQILWDGLEGYACNGSFTPFDAGEANPFVGLTSAPCIAECMNVDDEGTQAIEGRFWYFERYQVDCPLEKIRDEGRVIFTLAA